MKQIMLECLNCGAKQSTLIDECIHCGVTQAMKRHRDLNRPAWYARRCRGGTPAVYHTRRNCRILGIGHVVKEKPQALLEFMGKRVCRECQRMEQEDAAHRSR